MRFLLALAFCSLCLSACGDDDYGKGSLDFAVDEIGDVELGPVDLSGPDLSAVDNTDAGTDL